MTYLTKRQPVAALHRGEKRRSRLGEPAFRRLAIGVLYRLCELGRYQLPVELGHPKMVERSKHGARLELGRVPDLACLRDPLRHDCGADALHLMEMLADLGDRPAVFDGTGLPAVAGNG